MSTPQQPIPVLTQDGQPVPCKVHACQNHAIVKNYKFCAVCRDPHTNKNKRARTDSAALLSSSSSAPIGPVQQAVAALGNDTVASPTPAAVPTIAPSSVTRPALPSAPPLASDDEPAPQRRRLRKAVPIPVLADNPDNVDDDVAFLASEDDDGDAAVKQDDDAHLATMPAQRISFMPETKPSANPNYQHDRTSKSVTGYKGKSCPPTKNYMLHYPLTRAQWPAKRGRMFLDMTPMWLPSFEDERTGDAGEHLIYSHLAPYNALTITVGILKADCPEKWLLLMYQYMLAFGVSGIASLERGGNMSHLHVQAVLIIHSIACEGAKGQIAKHLKHWFDMWSNTSSHLSVGFIKETKDQKFMPMVGYCLKDHGQAHHKVQILCRIVMCVCHRPCFRLGLGLGIVKTQRSYT